MSELHLMQNASSADVEELTLAALRGEIGRVRDLLSGGVDVNAEDEGEGEGAATDGPRRLALLRLDADTYEGTLDILTNLYALVSPRGFIIIDDFHLVGVRAAVRAFRKRVGATGAMLPIAEDYVNSCRQGGAAGAMGRVPFHTTPNKPPQGMYWRKKHA